jgi:hypothetical protein
LTSADTGQSGEPAIGGQQRLVRCRNRNRAAQPKNFHHGGTKAQKKISKRKSPNEQVEMRPPKLASLGLCASVVKNLAVFQAVARCHVTAHADHTKM